MLQSIDSAADQAAHPTSRLLSGEAVCERLGGISRATLDRMVKAGEIGRGVQITRNRVGWPEAEITALIDARVRAARPEAA